jgi:hypothetical protein
MYFGIGTIKGQIPIYHIQSQLYVIFGAVIDANIVFFQTAFTVNTELRRKTIKLINVASHDFCSNLSVLIVLIFQSLRTCLKMKLYPKIGWTHKLEQKN